MRALKDELVRNKKIFEQLEAVRKQYEANRTTEGLSENEVKKRMHQVETVITKY